MGYNLSLSSKSIGAIVIYLTRSICRRNYGVGVFMGQRGSGKGMSMGCRGSVERVSMVPRCLVVIACSGSVSISSRGAIKVSEFRYKFAIAG